ncbi:MAG: bifunctional diaminohydroxyphosphoribosylaminopyrimidine deaminase/5-amino-6-(5-phosphoribosylamino)uracil reductase RibD [Deltaproteobacteria bacterium]|nr:bifunctional diaminohydroxyphosphoribosylaminopyrimidine deaminase/5-amino-6-(5-phosphoribosylamino)uracil reductase RibD [Deltaproteobacteria bacterium]
MRKALALAGKGMGRASPNPAVGAVIVKNGRVIGEGYHRKAGLPHAEIEAISAIRGRKGTARGATLYVTLEPCCHWGRTPPCTDAIISSGIKRVVLGMKDPNPLVSGKGIRILKDAGIDVVAGVLDAECRSVNEAYIKYITVKRPFVTLKLAVSLDGRIAACTGDSKWITGVKSRRLVHRMRSLTDAVMAGGSTVARDDPALTVRLVKGKDPVRAVVDSSLKIPLSSRVFGRGRPGGLIIFTTGKAGADKIRKARERGASVVVVPASKEGVLLKSVLKELGRRGITSLLVEGGGRLAASFLKGGLVDKMALFLSPVILGGDGKPSIGRLGIKKVSAGLRLMDMTERKVGQDILIEGYLR